MKKTVVFAVLVLSLLVGCSAKGPSLPEPDITLSSAQLCFGDETVTITNAVLLEQLQADVAALSFRQSNDNVMEPGAQTLSVKLVTSQGTEVSFTLPLFQSDGKTWDAGADSVSRFASYFED